MSSYTYDRTYHQAHTCYSCCSKKWRLIRRCRFTIDGYIYESVSVFRTRKATLLCVATIDVNHSQTQFVIITANWGYVLQCFRFKQPGKMLLCVRASLDTLWSRWTIICHTFSRFEKHPCITRSSKIIIEPHTGSNAWRRLCLLLATCEPPVM